MLHLLLKAERESKERDEALEVDGRVAIAALSASLAEVKNELLTAEPDHSGDPQLMSLFLAASGNAELVIVGGGAEDITAAELNAGTVTRRFVCELRTLAGKRHTWFFGSVTPIVTSSVGTPTIAGTPSFNEGRLTIDITFPTPGWVATDSVTVDIDVSSIPLLAFVGVETMTYTVT